MKILNALFLTLVFTSLVGSAHAVERTFIPVSKASISAFKKVFHSFKPKLQIQSTGATCSDWLSAKGPAKLVLHEATRVTVTPRLTNWFYFASPKLMLNTQVSGTQRTSLNQALQNGTAKVSVYPHKKDSSKATVSIRWKDSQGDHNIKEVLKSDASSTFSSGTRGGTLSPYKSLKAAFTPELKTTR